MGESIDAGRLLVGRMLRGDEAAFTELFDASFGPLFRFTLRRTDGDEDAAEEIVQEAMCLAIRKLSTFRGEASLLTWLMTFCRHEISAYYRKRRRTPPLVELKEELPEIRDAIASMSAGDPLLRKEISTAVQSILDALPSHYGDVLEWKYIDGLTVAGIAERLGVSAKAAESMLTRARAAFRDAFAAVGAELR
jgi:RNA polymerase sigma-70 factor (ECF subfamily)